MCTAFTLPPSLHFLRASSMKRRSHQYTSAFHDYHSRRCYHAFYCFHSSVPLTGHAPASKHAHLLIRNILSDTPYIFILEASLNASICYFTLQSSFGCASCLRIAGADHGKCVNVNFYFYRQHISTFFCPIQNACPCGA